MIGRPRRLRIGASRRAGALRYLPRSRGLSRVPVECLFLLIHLTGPDV